MIVFILLGFLNYQPMTGYDLKQSIDESSAHFWHAHHSQIYTTLRKMERDGLVASRFIKAHGSPNRRMYTITASGKNALKTWLEKTQKEVSPIKEELLVRLFFSARRDPQDVLNELHLQHKLHQEKAAAYQVISAHIPKIIGLERDEKFWRLTLDMGMRFEEMYIAWLKRSISTIQEN